LTCVYSFGRDARNFPRGGIRVQSAQDRICGRSFADNARRIIRGFAMSEPTDLVVARPEGLYCPPGDFFIDPWRPVNRAVITHAHGDHARFGHAHYLAAAAGATVMQARLPGVNLMTIPYGQPIRHGDVTLSLHPAGHVLGSAQVRIEHAGRVWVVSGDYYLAGERHDAREDNATCAPFEAVRCHCFITESTFGLPIYRWAPQASVFDAINAWWRGNAAADRASILYGYALGKAQRILQGVDSSIGVIIVHGAVDTLNRAYRRAGVTLPPTRMVGESAVLSSGCSLSICWSSLKSSSYSRSESVGRSST